MRPRVRGRIIGVSDELSPPGTGERSGTVNARVTTAHIRPDRFEEAVSIVRESVAPVVREQQGARSMLLLTDPDTGKGVTITLWETEEDMRAGETSGYVQEQYGKLAGARALRGQPPGAEGGGRGVAPRRQRSTEYRAVRSIMGGA